MPDFAVRSVIGAVDKFTTILSHMGVNMKHFGGEAETAFNKAERGASGFKQIFGGVLAGNLVTGAIQRIAGAVRQIPQMIEEFATRGEQIGKTSTMLGLSADAFQRLSYAATITNTPVDAMEGAFKKLNVGIGDFRRGMGPLHTTLLRLNPALAAQLRTVKSSDEAFMVVADAIQHTTNAQTRAAIAQAAFGRGGQALIPMLAQGREGLMKLRQEAGLYGSVLDADAIKASEQMAQSTKRLKGMVGSLKDQVLGFVIKAATPYVEKALVWLAANKEIVASKIENAISRAAGAFEAAKPVLQFIWKAAGWLINNWPLLLVVYVGWTAAQMALNVALDANPVGAIVIALEAMIAVVIIVIHYWRQITDALKAAWNWFDKLYNKSLLLRNAIFFLAGPVWLVVEAVRTLIDLLSGRGLKSFENFIPPWLKGATDKLGITQTGGGMWGNAEAKPPNAAAMESGGGRWNGHVWVHAEPGTGARVGEQPRGAPMVMGMAGANP